MKSINLIKKVIIIFINFIFINISSFGSIIYLGKSTVEDNSFNELQDIKKTNLFSISEIIDFVYSLPQYNGLKKPASVDDLYFSTVISDEGDLCLFNFNNFKDFVIDILEKKEYEKLNGFDFIINRDYINVVIYEKDYYNEYSKFNTKVVDLLINKSDEEFKQTLDDYGLTYTGKNNLGGVALNEFENLKFDASKINSKNIENVKKIYTPIKFILLKYNEEYNKELNKIDKKLIEKIEEYINNLNNEFQNSFYDYDYIFDSKHEFDSKKILKKYSRYLNFIQFYRGEVYLELDRKEYNYSFIYRGPEIPEEYFNLNYGEEFTNDTYYFKTNKTYSLQLLYNSIYAGFNFEIDIFDIYKNGKKLNSEDMLEPGNYVLKIKDEFLENNTVRNLNNEELKKYKTEFYKKKDYLDELQRKFYDDESAKKFIRFIPNKII